MLCKERALSYCRTVYWSEKLFVQMIRFMTVELNSRRFFSLDSFESYVWAMGPINNMLVTTVNCIQNSTVVRLLSSSIVSSERTHFLLLLQSLNRNTEMIPRLIGIYWCPLLISSLRAGFASKTVIVQWLIILITCSYNPICTKNAKTVIVFWRRNNWHY